MEKCRWFCNSINTGNLYVSDLAVTPRCCAALLSAQFSVVEGFLSEVKSRLRRRRRTDIAAQRTTRQPCVDAMGNRYGRDSGGHFVSGRIDPRGNHHVPSLETGQCRGYPGDEAQRRQSASGLVGIVASAAWPVDPLGNLYSVFGNRRRVSVNPAGNQFITSWGAGEFSNPKREYGRRTNRGPPRRSETLWIYAPNARWKD